MRFPLEFTTYNHFIIKTDVMTQDKRIVPLEASLMSPDCDGGTGERCLMTLPAKQTKPLLSNPLPN